MTGGSESHMQQRQRLWGETAVYVDNDVDVDDVDDDEEGAGAYFFWSDTTMPFSVSPAPVFLLHAECYENRGDDKPFY